MTLEWDRGRWRAMSRHAMVATPAGRHGLVLGIMVMALGVPAGLAIDAWTRANWGTTTTPVTRAAFFAMGLVACVVVGAGIVAGGWRRANAHVGRICDQSASVDGDVLSLRFGLAGTGLPDARHVVRVRLDPDGIEVRRDMALGVVTFVSPGEDTSIRHTYTREFSYTGTSEIGQAQYLAEWSMPDDFEPSLADVLESRGFDLSRA